MIDLEKHYGKIAISPVTIPIGVTENAEPGSKHIVPVYRQERDASRKFNLDDRVTNIEINGVSAGTAVIPVTTLQPFDVTFTDLGGGTQLAAIRPGTLTGIIPSNYLTTYTQNKSGTEYFLTLNVTMGGSPIGVTAVSLSFGTSPPAGIPTAAGGPPTSWTYLLGVVIEGIWYRTIGNGSLVAFPVESYRVSQSSPTPGTLPYDIYYTMSVVNA